MSPPKKTMRRDKEKKIKSLCVKWKCVWDAWDEEKRRGEKWGGGLRDGLSRDRLTEVMRGEDESAEHDSRIQIQSRLTLLEYVSLSKSSYPILHPSVHCTLTHTNTHTHTHTHTHKALSLFSTGLSSLYILPYQLSCYLFSCMHSPFTVFLSFQGL